MNNPKNKVEQMIIKLTEKVDTQYGDLDKRLDNIEKVMIAQEINLKDHMRRSDHLESIVEVMKEEDIKPLNKHVHMVEGVFKFLGLVSLLVGILGGLAKLFSLI